jgi:biopolymer transport protein ExbB
MKRLLSIIAIAAAGAAGAGQPTGAQSLDELLNQVRNARTEAAQRNKAREAEFLKARDQQRALVNQTRAELQTEEATSNRLTSTFQQNERGLNEKNVQLQDRLGNLGEVFGVVRQVAADTKGVVGNSLVSAQIPDRGALPSKLAQSKALPSIDELRGLHETLLTEMVESGKVVTFDANVTRADGSVEQGKVLRVGVFNASKDGEFLRFQPETGSLVVLTRQPAGRYGSMAQDLAEGEPGEVVEFGLDPTRGQLLAILVDVPTFLERVDQGGLVGYVTLTLGFLGLLVALERFAFMMGAEKRMKAQLEAAGKPNADNALGRVLMVYSDNRAEDIDTLELKLDEAIMKEVPEFEKRVGFIKLVAALGPLLGLLGTVTGMIATFQTITMFGSGDPKLMAGGISQALVTTVEGLCVAIPMVLLHGVVSSKSRSLIGVIEEQTAGIIAAHAEKSR